MEQTLGIRLPEIYRRSVVPFPAADEAGNSDAQVWDDADGLIALNQRLRSETEGWPAWLFAIGQAEGDPSGYAIDTRTPDCRVWWLEQMHLGENSGPIKEPFEAWFARCVEETTQEDKSGASILWILGVWLLLSAMGIGLVWILAFRGRKT
jgi:hypothetical protein